MIYDILIIGGGPAGISAAIYAKRAGRSVAIIERAFPGGQLGLIGQIENYAGFSKVDGNDLAYKFYQHAQSLNIPFIMQEAQEFDLSGLIKEVKCNKENFKAKAIILALGSHSRELNIEGEERLKGRGVSYCALCDGNFFKGKDVAVIGSGDSAFSDGVYLSNLCNKVYILTKDKLKLHNYAEDEFDNKNNVIMLKNAISKKIEGKDKVEKLVYIQDDKTASLEVAAVFVAIGRKPDTTALKGKVEMNEQGFIKTDDLMRTNVDGVFACGDNRANSIRQIATAVGDGAVAGTEASKYVIRLNHAHKDMFA